MSLSYKSFPSQITVMMNIHSSRFQNTIINIPIKSKEPLSLSSIFSGKQRLQNLKKLNHTTKSYFTTFSWVEENPIPTKRAVLPDPNSTNPPDPNPSDRSGVSTTSGTRSYRSVFRSEIQLQPTRPPHIHKNIA